MYFSPALDKRGLTLIELIVVVTIIAIIGGVVVSVLNPQTVQQKARDSQRLANLKMVQTAIELYKTENKRYPLPCRGMYCTPDQWVPISGGDTLSSVLVPNYISVMPNDPKSNAQGVSHATDPCIYSNFRYGITYKTDTAGSYYILTTQVELPSTAAESACNTLRRSGCTEVTPYCYGVESVVL